MKAAEDLSKIDSKDVNIITLTAEVNRLKGDLIIKIC